MTKDWDEYGDFLDDLNLTDAEIDASIAAEERKNKARAAMETWKQKKAKAQADYVEE